MQQNNDCPRDARTEQPRQGSVAESSRGHAKGREKWGRAHRPELKGYSKEFNEVLDFFEAVVHAHGHTRIRTAIGLANHEEQESAKSHEQGQDQDGYGHDEPCGHPGACSTGTPGQAWYHHWALGRAELITA